MNALQVAPARAFSALGESVPSGAVLARNCPQSRASACGTSGAKVGELPNCDKSQTGPTPITLVLPYPISANRYWASRVIKSKDSGKWMAITYVTAEAKNYKERVAEFAKAAGVRKPITGRVQIDIRLWPNRPQDWTRRAARDPITWDDTVMCIDLDNVNKVLLDALKGIAIDDDKWVRRITSERMEPDERGARVAVRITQLATSTPQGSLL